MDKVKYLKDLKKNNVVGDVVAKLSSVERDKLKMAAASDMFSSFMMSRVKGYEFIHDMNLDLMHANYSESIHDYI